MIGLKQRLDYQDFANLPDDGKRYELLDGDLLVTPSPSPLHQWVSKRLQRQLEAYFEDRSLGKVFDAPLDVILSLYDVFEPDLLVVRPDQISKRGIEGPPLLLVEILSPSTQDRDRSSKANRYAHFGVPHYWIVDPDLARIECYRLSESVYRLLVQAEPPAVLTHPDFPELTILLDSLRL
jgi:Uma2 family endonuclease